MNSLFRRRDNPNPLLTDDGETVSQALDSLTTALNNLVAARGDILYVKHKIGVIWNCVFKRETAPQKKYELAEEMLHRPLTVTQMLSFFTKIQETDVKRKIRDLFLFLRTWSSNDAPDASYPRFRAETPQQTFSQLLHDCRFAMYNIVHEGRDDPESMFLFNDVIRVFAEDERSVWTILQDKGINSKGKQVRTRGCVWSVLARLQEVREQRGFAMIAGFVEAMEMIFLLHHHPVSWFLERNFTEFTQRIHELIALNNFFIQAKALQLVTRLFQNPFHAPTRKEWMKSPILIQRCTLCLQSIHKIVRYEALVLFNIYLQNPQNSMPIWKFIDVNRMVLFDYFTQKHKAEWYTKVKGEHELLEESIELLRRWEAKHPDRYNPPQLEPIQEEPSQEEEE